MIKVAAFYKFTPLDNTQEIRQKIKSLHDNFSVLGTVIVADEGVNSTIAGKAKDIDGFLQSIENIVGEVSKKFSYCEDMPFHRFKVKNKKEIVTFHDKEVGADKIVGSYVYPELWNELIERDDVLLLDTRNRYETKIGTFKNAVDPQVDSFVEFKKYLDNVIEEGKVDKIAMFCTGGIRCEKSTGYALKKGIKEVYHLDGGILNYFDKVDNEESLWEGECFVFDQRVSVDQNLEQGKYVLCHSCGYPLDESDKQHEDYEEGVSCELCINETTEDQKSRFRDRVMQIELSESREQKHLGADMKKLRMVS